MWLQPSIFGYVGGEVKGMVWLQLSIYGYVGEGVFTAVYLWVYGKRAECLVWLKLSIYRYVGGEVKIVCGYKCLYMGMWQKEWGVITAVYI
uniref:Uncharacterized protein n=1 Tax=Pyxicephalus adspersus TaxID=30357 RepID=A0AAV3ASK5_PYXAD|nr:TPA: hypothetical protein GDO54_005718 [Pyxicephalus adspersus]